MVATWLTSGEPFHLMPKFKADKQEASFEALERMSIPELKEDFSNYEHWHHAVFFHLEFYDLNFMVTQMKQDYPDGLGNCDFQTEDDYQLYRRHRLHAYSILFSKAANAITKGPLWSDHHAEQSYCPSELFELILKMKEEARHPATFPGYLAYMVPSDECKRDVANSLKDRVKNSRE